MSLVELLQLNDVIFVIVYKNLISSQIISKIIFYYSK